MNKMTIKTTAQKAMFSIKKHSPEILVVAGVVGVVGSTIMACKASTKVSEILDETKRDVDQIHDVLADQGIPEEKYSQEDGKKDLAIVYAKTGVKLIKLYGPSVALGTLSITAILASNKILRKRNIALAAAYTTIDKSYKEYRSRVVERFGEKVDRELKYNIKAQQITEETVDENGKKKKVKKTIDVVNPNTYSAYSRIFDESNPNWEKDAEYNKMFIQAQQSYANDKLKAHGFLFLNDVYDMLGFEKTKAGQVVGWIYDPENGDGDNYIDFGIYDIHTLTKEAERRAAFINGYERSIILDFNVDGNIWEKM